MIFGSVIGLTISLIFSQPSDQSDLLTFSIAMLGLGTSAGHLVDRFRTSINRCGKVTFGLWEFLVIVTILAIMIVTIQVFPKMLV